MLTRPLLVHLQTCSNQKGGGIVVGTNKDRAECLAALHTVPNREDEIRGVLLYIRRTDHGDRATIVYWSDTSGPHETLSRAVANMVIVELSSLLGKQLGKCIADMGAARTNIPVTEDTYVSKEADAQLINCQLMRKLAPYDGAGTITVEVAVWNESVDELLDKHYCG
ncbi:hypothetical protein WJX72_011778 [[Myrmecia] bisecta]|uniref:Uncharacterized protein n=1 Tax=[Myrmecia] bisecta TaxID=41462 RepID=A0AAW1PB80_9CHLO